MKLLLICIPFLLFSKPAPIKKLSKDEKILFLIEQEEKAISSVKRKPAHLHYRFFELQVEKLKLIEKKENLVFIKNPGADRAKYFTKTRSQYFRIKEMANKIRNTKKATKYIAPAFYALALAARDFRFEENDMDYLNLALKFAPRATKIRYDILVAKAEKYYNTKKYKEAYELYKRIVKNTGDNWYTKNLYNFAWAQFKTHRFDPAIHTLEEAYKYSKSKMYVDFSEQIMNSLIVFYVTHGRVEDAIGFILKSEKQPAPNLLKLAKKASKKGFYEQTQYIIKLIYSHYDKKDIIFLSDVKYFELEHYKEFNKKDFFFKTVKSLESFAFNKDLYEPVSFLVTAEVSDLQQILKKTYKEHDASYDKKLLAYTLYYFDRLTIYNPPDKLKYFFYSAETLYSVKQFKRSIPFYKLAVSKKDEHNLNQKVIDALYIAIEAGREDQKEYFKNLEYVYTTVIDLKPKEEKTEVIYKKLYSLYKKQNRLERMDWTLSSFRKNFPKKSKEHREMFRSTVDYLIAASNTLVLSKKLNKMRQGFLGFEKVEIKKTVDILANLLFDKYKKMRVGGSNKQALKGYQSIYTNNKYPKIIRAQAALNMSVIYTDQFDNNQTVKWMKKTYEMDKKIFHQLHDTFVKLADRTLLFQDFRGANRIYSYYLSKRCQNDIKISSKVFRNIVSSNLANNYTTRVKNSLKKFSDCISPADKEWTYRELAANYIAENNFIAAADTLQRPFFTHEERFSAIESLYWRNKATPRLEPYLLDKKNPQSKDFASFIKTKELFKSKETALRRSKVTFPAGKKPEDFNKDLNDYFTKISSLIETYDQLVSFKKGYESAIAMEQLSGILARARNMLSSLKAPIKDPNFQKAFNQQMGMLAKNFGNQQVQYSQVREKFINDYNVLVDNVQFPVITRSPASIKTIDEGSRK